MKNFLKRKKSPKPPEPRTIEDIQKVYTEILSKAAQIQYQVYVYKQELEKCNRDLVFINQEAAARQALDKASAKATEGADTNANS